MCQMYTENYTGEKDFIQGGCKGISSRHTHNDAPLLPAGKKKEAEEHAG